MERRERHGRGTEARPSGSSQISMAILPLLLLTASKRVLVGQLWVWHYIQLWERFQDVTELACRPTPPTPPCLPTWPSS